MRHVAPPAPTATNRTRCTHAVGAVPLQAVHVARRRRGHRAVARRPIEGGEQRAGAEHHLHGRTAGQRSRAHHGAGAAATETTKALLPRRGRHNRLGGFRTRVVRLVQVNTKGGGNCAPSQPSTAAVLACAQCRGTRESISSRRSWHPAIVDSLTGRLPVGRGRRGGKRARVRHLRRRRRRGGRTAARTREASAGGGEPLALPPADREEGRVGQGLRVGKPATVVSHTLGS
eukprot:COSAG04_NODE_2690_length_3726_cov_69.609935_2_plen_231_part_00